MIRPHRAAGWLLLLALAAAAHAGDALPPGGRESALPGFRLVSWAGEEPTAELARELQRIRPALVAWIGANLRPLPAELPPLPVLLFADRASFQDYAAANARQVATAHAEGFYAGDGTPGGGRLVLFRDGGRELTTARHEYVHYLVDQLLPARAGQPVWFNEGLAVVVEDAWIDPGAVRLPAVPLQRQATLRRLARDGGAPLAEVTALASDSWLEAAAAGHAAADAQYSASYGAVLYLLNEHPARYWGFLRRLAQGQAHAEAWTASFDAIAGGLDAAWRAWAVRGAWEAARARDGRESAAWAYEVGLSWLPSNLPPGDAVLAARWLAAAGRGFAQAEGYALDGAAAWLAASEALAEHDPAAAGTAGETAAGLYAGRGHLAGQARALIAACHGWGDDAGRGDWARAATAGRLAVQLAESTGGDGLRAAAYAAYGACLMPDRAGADPPEAEAALGRARIIHSAAGETGSEATVVLLLAQALAPPDGQGRPEDWRRCLALAAEALALWQRLPGDEGVAGRARALAMLGGLARPDRNPQGDWAAAARHYAAETELLAGAGAARRLRNLLDRGACGLGMQDAAGAARHYAAAEAAAIEADDQGLAAFAAYQRGWALQQADPAGAAAAYLRAAPRYRAAGKLREEAMAVSQAAQAAAAAGTEGGRVAGMFARAAELERARGDAAREAYCRYQQAWFSEPARARGADPAASAATYAAAARLWSATDPARAAQALQQRARVLTPEAGAAGGWAEAATAWKEAAAAWAGLPEGAEGGRQRAHALHQQAWCLVRGDGRRLTPEARALFAEAARLHLAAGDAAAAEVSTKWIR